MKRLIIITALFASFIYGQQAVRFSATTGNVSLSGTTTTATLQQPATNAGQTYIDLVTIYCSVTFTITQAANGAAATTTTGTVTPLLPTPLNTTVPVNFFTASNVGTGTAQGGSVTMTAGTMQMCFAASCPGVSAPLVLGTGGTGANYSFTIASLTGTVNITIIGHVQ